MSAPWDVAAGRDQLQEQLEQSRGLVRDLTTVLGKRNADIKRLRAYIQTLDGKHIGQRTDDGAAFIDEGVIVADDVLAFTGEQAKDKSNA